MDQKEKLEQFIESLKNLLACLRGVSAALTDTLYFFEKERDKDC